MGLPRNCSTAMTTDEKNSSQIILPLTFKIETTLTYCKPDNGTLRNISRATEGRRRSLLQWSCMVVHAGYESTLAKKTHLPFSRTLIVYADSPEKLQPL